MAENANDTVVIVMTTMPDRASALRLARLLVDERRAACVNVMADCTSIYRWQDKVETATEVPMVIKTSASAYASLEESIRKNHPYDVPEILGVPAASGFSAYLDWVLAESAQAAST